MPERFTGVALSYAVHIACKGFEQAVKDDPALAPGVNVYRGNLAIESVAQAHGLSHTPLSEVMSLA